ncbi:MAG: hypothetical protein M3O00_02020 [Pseudomonadota bacterium]|nr:hypothetical protein [Pseudomonadota bacterium]
MKTTILSLALASAMLGALPLAASEFAAGSHIAGLGFDLDPSHDADVFERRGRGRGGDDDRSGDVDNDRDDDRRGGGASSSDDSDTRSDNGDGHGGRPRIPGGSGCDDPGDLIEHPECRLAVEG